MNLPTSCKEYRYLLLSILGILFIRLITLGSLAILDPSEGRYAVIGQSMLISDNIITPFTYEEGSPVPFLAKPILHSWITAASFLILGVNEFAARFPSFLVSAITLFSLFIFLTPRLGPVIALNSLLVLASSALFFIMSGACLVDMTLSLSTVLIGVGFGVLAFSEHSRRLGGYVMVAGAVIGFLAKGPIALVLASGPIALWIMTTKRWSILKKIPWISGAVIFLGLTVPWFIIAERANPGFSEYFFVHENFLRFVSSKYGDRYGSGHTRPMGSIWLMYIGAFLPWSLVWLKVVIFNRKSLHLYRDHLRRYIFLFAIFPAIFFTFGKQTSIYYVLPGLPWMAVLTALILPTSISNIRTDTLQRLQLLMIYVAVIISLCLLILGFYDNSRPIWLISAALIIIGLVISTKKLLIKLVGEPLDLEGYPRRFYLMTSTERDEISGQLIATCAIGSVMILSVVTTALTARISMQQSTRELVEKLESSPTLQTIPPVFLRKIPHSAYFYSRLGKGSDGALASPQHPLNLASIIETKEELEMAEPKIVIGTRKDIKKMALIEKGWISVETIGPWCIFERPSPEDANHSTVSSVAAPPAEQLSRN